MAVIESAVSAFTFAPFVTFTHNVESGVPLVYLPDARVVSLSEPLGEVCEAIVASDTPSDKTELAVRMDKGRWNPDRISKALRVLVTAGIIREVGAKMDLSVIKQPPRLEFHPPFTIKLTLLNPEALCRRMSPLARSFRGRLGVVFALVGAGIQAFFWSGVVRTNNRFTAQGNGQLALTFILLTITCLFHEMAHGVVLADRGGSPRRLGIMLLYLIPSFFCDVSDGFRLSKRSQIEVALAGVMLQCQFGALIAPFTLLPGPNGLAIRHYLGVNLLIVTLNLVPFVALDGYFALRVLVGLPNLRSRAIAAWRTWVSGILRYRQNHPHWQSRWIIAYGAGAVLMPPLMIAWSLYTWVVRYWMGNAILCVILAVCLSLIVSIVVGVRRTIHCER